MSRFDQLFTRPYLGIPFVLLLITSLFPGCTDSTVEEESVQVEVISFADQNVTILIPESITEVVGWEAVLDEWKAQTQGGCNIKTYSSIEELLSEFEQQTPKANTILFYPRTAFGDLGVREIYDPIPEFLYGPEDLNIRDLFDSLAAATTKWNGEPVSFPIREPMLLMYYRTDIFENAGIVPPQSWNDYLNLLKTREEWSSGLSILEPWSPEFRSITFLVHALPYVKSSGNYSVFFDYKDGTPLIDSPGFVRGMEDCREMLPLLDPQSTSFSPQDCLAEIEEGRAALVLGAAFQNPQVLPREDDEVATKKFPIAAIPVPGATTLYDPGRASWMELDEKVNRASVTGWDGLAVAVLNAGRNVENQAAWNLLRTLIVDYSDNCFVPGFQTSTRLSKSTQIWSPQFSKLNERSHVEAVRESLREAEVVPALIIHNRKKFLNALSEVVDNAIIDPKTPPAEALKNLATTWSTIMEESGKETILNSYAGGLGIRAFKDLLVPKTP